MSKESHSSYDASSMPIGLDKEVERLRNQALITWEKEARNLTWMGLKGDMSVLEVGSGPGFVTEALARLVSDGEVTALEIDPVLIERAEAYLGGKECKNWRIVQGNVMSTGLPENSFDFVYARYLFQHLPDVVGAAREAMRVLKPGGKLVVFDVDDETNIFDPPPSPEVKVIEERMAKAFRDKQASQGGNRLIGRRLLNVLRDAGFEKVDLESIVMHNLLTDLSTLIPNPTYESMHPMVEAGQITEEELRMMLDDVELFVASDPVILIGLLMACGEKPPAGEK